jgi:hypothetical protein
MYILLKCMRGVAVVEELVLAVVAVQRMAYTQCLLGLLMRL